MRGQDDEKDLAMETGMEPAVWENEWGKRSPVKRAFQEKCCQDE